MVEVEACAKFAGEKVNIDSQQLTLACSTLTFGSLQPGSPPGNPITVILDNDGNATVSLMGTDCAAGSNLIEADLIAAPYLTATTALTILPPAVTTVGVTGYPANEVETGDSTATGTSDVYAVFYVETDPTYAEGDGRYQLDPAVQQLSRRCPHGHRIWEPRPAPRLRRRSTMMATPSSPSPDLNVRRGRRRWSPMSWAGPIRPTPLPTRLNRRPSYNPSTAR